MDKRKRLGKDRILNCFIPVLYLLFTGRLRAVIWAWPFHFLGITKNNRLVHFKNLKTKDRCKPLWFRGYMEVLRENFLPKWYFQIGFVNGHKISRRRKNGTSCKSDND